VLAARGTRRPGNRVPRLLSARSCGRLLIRFFSSWTQKGRFWGDRGRSGRVRNFGQRLKTARIWYRKMPGSGILISLQSLLSHGFGLSLVQKNIPPYCFLWITTAFSLVFKIDSNGV
jgi:hypothetical protein